MKKTTSFLVNFSKGALIGAADVIPGVSGGTISLITKIYERNIKCLKSFDLYALKLLFKGNFKKFSIYTDFLFFLAVQVGQFIGIYSFARVLHFLFTHYPIFVWSFFMGLIIASVFFIIKSIEKWRLIVVFWLIVGIAGSSVISLLTPAVENDTFLYLILCGILATSSLVLPGISGSYILILLGNYKLILHSLSTINLRMLIPSAIGNVIGMLGFSHLLSWFFRHYRNQTLGLLSGFILGSFPVIWPWKHYFTIAGNLIPFNRFGELMQQIDYKSISYKLYLPEFNFFVILSILVTIAGFFSIWIIEKAASKDKTKSKTSEILADFNDTNKTSD